MSEDIKRYRDNALDGFRSGAVLDLRVRIAVELLTHSPMFGPGPTQPVPMLVPAGHSVAKDRATMALDVATELLALAESRGLVEALDSPEGAMHLEANVRRQVEYEATKMRIGTEIGAREQGRVATVGNYDVAARRRSN